MTMPEIPEPREPVLSIAIKRGRRGGFLCTVGQEAAGEFDMACSKPSETAEWFSKIFFETFSEQCFVPVVYVPQAPQQQRSHQQQHSNGAQIPEVEPFERPAFMEPRPEDPSLVSKLSRRMNGVAVLMIACVIAGKGLLGA